MPSRIKQGVRGAAAPRWRSSRRAAAALLELRPHLGAPEATAERNNAQRAAGYHFARGLA
jgi:hypothetical protein